MRDLLADFHRDECGGVAIEYALAVMGIAVATIKAIQFIGINLSDTFETLADALKQ